MSCGFRHGNSTVSTICIPGSNKIVLALTTTHAEWTRIWQDNRGGERKEQVGGRNLAPNEKCKKWNNANSCPLQLGQSKVKWKRYMKPYHSHCICAPINFAQWRYSNQWSNREVLLLLVENYTQYPAISTWNTVVLGNFCRLIFEQLELNSFTLTFYLSMCSHLSITISYVAWQWLDLA